MTHTRIAFNDKGLIAEVTHPKLAVILEEISGFDEILASAKNIVRPIETVAPAETNRFAQRFIDGEDPSALVAEYAQAKAAADAHQTARALLIDTARGIHDRRLSQFLDSHRSDIAAGLARQFQRIVDETKRLLPELEHVHTGEDLALHPEAAPAYAAFIGYARQLDEWVNFKRFRFGHTRGGDFPDAELVRNIREVAPAYWEQKNRRASIWPDTPTMLRQLAVNGAVMWVPTPDDLEAKRAELRDHADQKTREKAERLQSTGR